MLGEIVQRRHRLDMMTTSLSPLSPHATVREPLGLLTYCSVKLPRRDRWSVARESTVRAEEEELLYSMILLAPDTRPLH
jgi:hypothetical protein